MTNFLDEEVPPVNPLSVAALEEVGRCFLAQLAPRTLEYPQPLDVLGLVDVILPQFGINVYPATREELGDRDGATVPSGDAEVTILVSESEWEALEEPPPRSHHARTTVCHEIGHAILHVPVLRRRLLLTNVLARAKRQQLPAYMDPEWQAWMFAGAILMPSVTLKMLKAQSMRLVSAEISGVYQVSDQMARAHLRRLKWPHE